MMPRKPYISSGISFEPLEETLDVKPLGSSLSIAIPKENAFQENRIALSPDAVGVLVNNGHTVSVENKAGEGAHFSDKDYAEAGALIVYDKKEIFRSELVVKSAPVSDEELSLLRSDHHFSYSSSRDEITYPGKDDGEKSDSPFF